MASILVAVTLTASGCGGGGGVLYGFSGTGALDIENSEVSTTWIDVMELWLEEPDFSEPFFEWGYEWVESRHNRDPNESEHFSDLTPGWWEVIITWSDGVRTHYGNLHIGSGETDNLEVTR